MIAFSAPGRGCLGGVLIATLAAQDPLADGIAAALTAARPVLAAQLAGERDSGQLGLLCLASLHDGMPATEEPLREALARLCAAGIEQTYALSLRLLVAEACPTLPGRATIGSGDYRRLLRNRTRGAFTYSEDGGTWDLSNTHAALGLRAAAALGVEVPRSVWLELADAAADAQRSDGSFGYQAGDDRPGYASMTAAGIAVLAICRQALQRPGRTIPELDRRLRRAWRWFADRPQVVGDADQQWSFYFHYGLERAAILDDVNEIGGVDWYRRGAQMFVDLRLPAGGWAEVASRRRNLPGSAAAVDTAFAVLFLRRKFQKVSGPITGARTVVLQGLGPQSTAADVDACVAGLVERGKSALIDVLKALRDELPARRRAAARALATIAGEDFGIDPDLDAERNAEALRRAELWFLRHR